MNRVLIFDPDPTKDKFQLFLNISDFEEISFTHTGDIEEVTRLFFEENFNTLFFNSEYNNDLNYKLIEKLNNSNRSFYPAFFLTQFDKKTIYDLYMRNIDLVFCIPENEQEAIDILEIYKRYYFRSFRNIDYENLISESKSIEISNEFNLIPAAINQLAFNLPAISENPKKLELSLYEVIVNAIEHGNLGITANEKKQSIIDNTYYNLLDERKNNPEYNKRRVKINSLINKEYCKYVIEDEGEGFDWRERMQKEVDLLSEHGRGILMIKTFFDVIEYNEKGNVVTMIKYSDFIRKAKMK